MRVTPSLSSGCFSLCSGNPSPQNVTPFYYLRAQKKCTKRTVSRFFVRMLGRDPDLFASIIVRRNFIPATVGGRWEVSQNHEGIDHRDVGTAPTGILLTTWEALQKDN
jgi:hypothetical protein